MWTQIDKYQFKMDKEMCRLCLTKNLINKIFCDSTIIRKIQTFCDIKMDNQDYQLPNCICVTCADKLDEIFDFKNKCENNDRLLRETWSKNINIKVEYEPSNVDYFEYHNIKSEQADHVINDDNAVKTEDKCDKEKLTNIHTVYLDQVQKNPIYEVISTNISKIIKNKAYKHKQSKDTLISFVSCGKKIHKQNAKFHILTGNEGKMIKCNSCGLKLASKTCYRQHKKRDHIKITKLRQKKIALDYFCPYCGTKFKQYKYYIKHLHEHNPRPFECDVCNKTFTMKIHLTSHLISHNGVSGSNQCYICGKIYKDPYIAKSHVKTHYKSNIIECKICGKSMTKSNYRFHCKTHTGEKKFECDICKKKFISKTCIKSHMIVHIGSKPFECRFCATKFANKKTYTDHERLHTGERPHQCPVCNKGFVQLSNMKSHFRNNHKGIEFIYKNKLELKREKKLVNA